MKKSFCGVRLCALFLLICTHFGSLSAQENLGPKRFRLPFDLREVSGLAAVTPDSLWWHNDGGNDATIFLTDRSGELLYEKNIGVRNRDWEDLSCDPEGRLYLGDFGDNRRVRDDLIIYRYDPQTEQVDSFPFQFPNQARHDTEAFFIHQDTFHLFTKHRISRAKLMTYHYVVPAVGGGQTAVLRDSLALRKRVVTAAAIHPETGAVALLAYYYTKRLGFIPYSAANLYFLRDYPDGHFLKGRIQSRRISFVVATQYEAVDFLTDRQLMVASEQTLFIKAKAKRKRTRR